MNENKATWGYFSCCRTVFKIFCCIWSFICPILRPLGSTGSSPFWSVQLFHYWNCYHIFSFIYYSIQRILRPMFVMNRAFTASYESHLQVISNFFVPCILHHYTSDGCHMQLRLGHVNNFYAMTLECWQQIWSARWKVIALTLQVNLRI